MHCWLTCSDSSSHVWRFEPVCRFAMTRAIAGEQSAPESLGEDRAIGPGTFVA